METFSEKKPFVQNRKFSAQRQQCLAGLSDDMIDQPIVELARAINRLPYCFTLQCCFGHFVYPGQPDPHNLAPLTLVGDLTPVEYRIAYLAFCMEDSPEGVRFLASLQQVTAMDPANIQFGCADWFWERQVNSYVLQVEPDRYKYQDRAVLNGREALEIEQVRNRFYDRLRDILHCEKADHVV